MVPAHKNVCRRHRTSTSDVVYKAREVSTNQIIALTKIRLEEEDEGVEVGPRAQHRHPGDLAPQGTQGSCGIPPPR